MKFQMINHQMHFCWGVLIWADHLHTKSHKITQRHLQSQCLSTEHLKQSQTFTASERPWELPELGQFKWKKHLWTGNQTWQSYFQKSMDFLWFPRCIEAPGEPPPDVRCWQHLEPHPKTCGGSPCHFRGSIVMEVPLYRWMVFLVENPMKVDDLGVPPCQETSIYSLKIPQSWYIR
jgi:hypothetical protein